jgi:ABC-2 type transport system ATP-binding protein
VGRIGPMSALVQAEDVTARFGPLVAVRAVGLTVERGEVVGLLGANGAGKTTLIRLLLGLLRPSGGVVLLLGAPPSLSTRRRCGYVPQTLGLYPDITVEENWRFVSAAFGHRGQPVPEAIAPWRRQLVGQLSLGTQRRVALSLALAHQPELLVLDEPTSGVSSLSQAQLWEQVRSVAETGVGALVTTHNMEEAEQCDRLVVMADGEVVVSGTASEVIGGKEVAEVSCNDWSRAFEWLERAGYMVQVHAGRLRVDGPPKEVSQRLTGQGFGATVRAVPANLEEAFMSAVKRA